jgi:hypothetical protein
MTTSTIPDVGPARDKALAEKLGLEYLPTVGIHLSLSTPAPRTIGHVSTDPIAAFRLVQHLVERGYRVKLEHEPDAPAGMEWEATIGKTLQHPMCAADPADAITQAIYRDWEHRGK